MAPIGKTFNMAPFRKEEIELNILNKASLAVSGYKWFRFDFQVDTTLRNQLICVVVLG